MGSVFGYEIESELPLSRLRPAPGSRGTIRVVRADRPLLDESAEVIALDLAPLPAAGDDAVFLVGRVPGGHLIACSVTGGFRFADEAMTIEVDPRGDPQMWEHRLLAVAIPLLLASRGDLALHAAVIEVEGRAALLCGPPMRGKSTLALAYAELGHRVLSEDGAVLERSGGRSRVWPAASGARIRTRLPGGASTKVVHDLPGDEPEPLSPGAVVLLDERGGERSGLLDRSTALVRTSAHLMHLGGRASVGPAFAALAGLVGEVPVLRASMPDDLGRLPEAAARLAREIALAARPAGK